MQRNVAGQKIGAQLVSATDGSAFTGAVTVAVTIDAGTLTTGSVGSGACTHEGSGYHTYAPAQAETNGALVAFTFTGTGAVPVTVQVFTNTPQTGDNFVRLGAPAGASVSADIAAIKADTAGISGIAGSGPIVERFGELGDFDTGDFIDAKFVTRVGSTLTALAGSPTLAVYRDNSTTEILTGITLTPSFDAVTGLNHVRIDTSALTAGSNYQVKIQTGTVSGTSVVGLVVGSFSLQARAALRPTVAKRTADVNPDGQLGMDWGNIGNPTATVALANTTTASAGDLGLILADIQARLPAALIDGRIDANLGFEVIQSIWDALTATLNTEGSVGKLVSDSLTALQQTGLHLDNMIEPDGPDFRYTANALERGAAGSGGSVAEEVLNGVIEGTLTLRESQRLQNAAAAGRVTVSGVPVAQVRIRDLNDSKDRIVASVDGVGNRTPTGRDVS